MLNDLKYQVRSREIGDLVSLLRSGRLILSPYFQRNLVWRDSHKHDFIETILLGLPFPQIFLARGPIDVNTMESFTCVVDGQQRLNAIREYSSGIFPVNGKYFKNLTNDEKTAFIKYEVPVIDFDLDAGDPRLKDVFKRLNRTFYSLSTIERIATEYSSSEFLLIARVLCGDIAVADVAEEEFQVAMDVFDDAERPDVESEADANEFLRDPGITVGKWAWLQGRAGGAFATLMADYNVFTPYEYQRKVPLMFVLNVMATILGGYYGRNAKVKQYLEDYNTEFPQSEQMLDWLNDVAEIVRKINLPKKTIWWSKANFFTMICELATSFDHQKLVPDATREKLVQFAIDPPREFQIAAREAVNNRPERITRAETFRQLVVTQ
ncbi:DUF262 domain-containing protein [Rhizobium lusitanum]|uniref:DUF262 domain-containing protein n=1 Tax=Rhizobium lusitanum TaxID=293958 RepID=A0A6L9TXN4_9HYPH|nr:DUF262 domain-containing protein [Rhizobium lusitanum]NEI67989.1 DUF262 domain-containing protein [Rhizobium lusitanum]